MSADPLRHYREHSLAVWLFLLVADYESRILSAYHQHGFADILRSHGAVLRHLGREGATISELAQRAGITKQSVGRMVRDLESQGYLQVRPCAQDRRRRIVQFSARGEQLVAASATIIESIRADYEQRLGVRQFDQFCGDLEAALAALAIAPGILEHSPFANSGRFHHFGRLLVELAEAFEQQLLAQLAAPLRPLVSRPLLNLLHGLQAEGSSISELAQPLPVSVQAVSQSVRRLVAAGVFESRAGELDSRLRSVVLTPMGADLVASLAEANRLVRDNWCRQMGLKRLLNLERELQALVYPARSQ